MKEFLRQFKFFIRIKESILAVFYFIRWQRPVWFFINREGRRLYVKNLPELNNIQRRIVEDLKRDGIAFTNINELFSGQIILPKLQEFSSELRRQARLSGKKKFLLDLWETSQEIDLSQPFVKLSLEEKVLEIVSAYLEMYPKFYYYALNVALPVGKGEEAVQSQRWHRDPEDKKMCKMFLYLNDVDEETGPFIYVRGSQDGGKWRNLYPQKPPHGVYPPEGEIEKIIPAEEIKISTAPAGTIIFCDTSGLHKGGYATAKERTMFTAGYISKASRWKHQYKTPENFEEKLAGKSEIVKYALEG
jgi:hypothetical protein